MHTIHCSHYVYIMNCKIPTANTLTTDCQKSPKMAKKWPSSVNKENSLTNSTRRLKMNKSQKVTI